MAAVLAVVFRCGDRMRDGQAVTHLQRSFGHFDRVRSLASVLTHRRVRRPGYRVIESPRAAVPGPGPLMPHAAVLSEAGQCAIQPAPEIQMAKWGRL
eukprot:766760-Hanusia_phi.AAC.1